MLALAVLFAAGCEPTPQDIREVQAENQDMVQHPSTIATMPDGRVLYCIKIHYIGYGHHFVYYFGTNDTKTVSVNYIVQSGKTSHNQTIVLDGKTFKASNETPHP